ncbi:MAG: YitT family protein, partial [Oscillospiraceae bacterium]|nr:YitT family protein [Oscillospiraceae bacterium]
NLIMLTDAVVIAISAVFFGLEAALFAVIAVFICGQVIDRILYGADTGKLLIIVTRDVSKVSAAIMSTLDRGATLLRGEGAFSGSEQDVILCAVRRSEVYRVRGLVRGIDKSAFMVVCDASEILGEGFRAIDTNEFGETVDDDN